MTSNYPLTDVTLPLPQGSAFFPWEKVDAHAWAYGLELSMAIDRNGPSRWIGTHDAHRHLFRKVLRSVVLALDLLEDPELTAVTFLPRQAVHALVAKVAPATALTGKGLAKIHVLTEKIVGRYLSTCRREGLTTAEDIYRIFAGTDEIPLERLEPMEPLRLTPKPIASYEITRNVDFQDTISFLQDSGKVSLIKADTRVLRERLCRVCDASDLPREWRVDLTPDVYIETDGHFVTWCGSKTTVTPDNESFRYFVNYAVHQA